MEHYQRLKDLFDVMEEGHLLLEVVSRSSNGYDYVIRECNEAFVTIFDLHREIVIDQNLHQIGVISGENYQKLTSLLEDVYMTQKPGKRDVFFSEHVVDATVVATVSGAYIDLLMYNWSKRDVFGGLDQMNELMKIFVSRQLCYMELNSEMHVYKLIGDFEKVFHVNRSDIDEKEDLFKNLIYHRDYDLFQQTVEQLQPHEVKQMTIRILGHHGEKGWARVDLMKTGSRIAAIVENVNSYKLLELEYQDQKETLRNVQKLTATGNWEWDVSNDQYRFSEGLMNLLDVAPREVDEIKQLYRLRMSEATCDMRQSMMGHQHIYEYLKNSGERIWLSDKQQIQYDMDGNAVKIFGITQEITRDKELYDQIVKLNSEYEAIYQSVKAAILVVEVLESGHFRYLNANTEALELFEYDLEEMVGAAPEALMDELGQKLRNHYTNCTKNMESIRVMEKIYRYGKDCKLIFLLSPTIEDGRVKKIVVSAFEHF
ncbi:MAG: PAS domain-containing protein [Clostridia bacterium]|nr:PAS domain-containing protein [Clostridia bacterium]